MANLKDHIACAADPEAAKNRLDYLVKNTEIETILAGMPESSAAGLVNIISLSSFLYRFICRNFHVVSEFATPFSPDRFGANRFPGIEELKRFKYEQLLKIIWMDITGSCTYTEVLESLSSLAGYIVKEGQKLIHDDNELAVVNTHMTAFALGKLGANELNFSSDIDLIFVCSNTADIDMDIYAYQQLLQDSIRKLSNLLENRDANGFLYRVDLKLRPWGKSGPLVMTLDETENYYEASSEAWERFAWLRARAILGSKILSAELLKRLNPFIYRRSLSSDDLVRFMEIKSEMAKMRRKKGYWNVKVGEGGIRDLEFFIQMLQMVNAHTCPELQVTGTLKVLSALEKYGLVTGKESAEITHSYLFLRRLENHLQMIDEQQTHELPEDWKKRTIIARSLGIPGRTDGEILDNFETELFTNRSIAKNYFDRLLPGE